MDHKKLEVRLNEWASDLGFTLPDGSAPPANYFAPLVASPARAQLWETIMKVAQPKDKVDKIRKQIFLSKLKSGKAKPTDGMLRALHQATTDKIDLWKKKEFIEKKIAEKKAAIKDLEATLENKVTLIQADVCKNVETENQLSEHKEKTIALKLIAEKYGEKLTDYSNTLDELKKLSGMYDSQNVPQKHRHDLIEGFTQFKKDVTSINKKCNCENGSENCDIYKLVLSPMDNHHTPESLRTLLVSIRAGYTAGNSHILHSVLESEDNKSKENLAKLTSVKACTEKVMLDITEKLLHANLQETEAESLDLKFDESIKKLTNLVLYGDEDFSGDQDFSFLDPNESFNHSTEKSDLLDRIKNGLLYIALKKQRDCLRSNIAALQEESKSKENYLEEQKKADQKLLESKQKLEANVNEIRSLKSKRDSIVQEISVQHEKINSVVNEIDKRISSADYVDELNEGVEELRNIIELQTNLFHETPLNAFRRIQTSAGKEVFEYESLPHCFNHYGGEFKEILSLLKISPCQNAEVILSHLEERRKFFDYVKNLIAKSENTLQEHKTLFSKLISNVYDSDVAERNNKEIFRALTKIVPKLENLKERIQQIENLWKYWLEQPFRHMIPDSYKVNDLTIRQYESQYEKDTKLLKYYSK